ncbi:predicted protein [Sclerotinia sclerotiorum 1980 UF-70]|uniref:Uncharacterized protein n=2 Tax=Sclerotinia sclerotiorum (strain ATCC 18683 / 1980 / Ss-1) TaxID=665079 RepID=A7EQT7_SCLS1|nr:predicted protein [Sclerotinia sclerotiorum 1980 UF-70]APA13652.1 hypothetical protein sscle_11g084220 [Sclerotinia sclerotiorum 1980 UF-70]EDN91829.1 predicted protein [Sclerotinia sclerotiorum 1980 UF-70]
MFVSASDQTDDAHQLVLTEECTCVLTLNVITKLSSPIALPLFYAFDGMSQKTFIMLKPLNPIQSDTEARSTSDSFNVAPTSSFGLLASCFSA